MLVAVVGFLFFACSTFIYTLFLACALGYILAGEWPRFKLWWLTPWYPVLPFLALIDVYIHDKWLWAYLVCVVAAYDTGAYSIGKLWGSTKIAPTISGQKTIEGLLGGLLSAGIMSFFLRFLLQKTLCYGIIFLLLQGCAIGLVAFFGDLWESWCKRKGQLKDAGALLPGHGGLLDRIDGLLLAALVYDILLITGFML